MELIPSSFSDRPNLPLLDFASCRNSFTNFERRFSLKTSSHANKTHLMRMLIRHVQRLKFSTTIEESGANGNWRRLFGPICAPSTKANQVGSYAVDTSDSGEGTMELPVMGQGTAGSGHGGEGGDEGGVQE